jgi:hypothetical protein
MEAILIILPSLKDKSKIKLTIKTPKFQLLKDFFSKSKKT